MCRHDLCCQGYCEDVDETERLSWAVFVLPRSWRGTMLDSQRGRKEWCVARRWLYNEFRLMYGLMYGSSVYAMQGINGPCGWLWMIE